MTSTRLINYVTRLMRYPRCCRQCGATTRLGDVDHFPNLVPPPPTATTTNPNPNTVPLYQERPSAR